MKCYESSLKSRRGVYSTTIQAGGELEEIMQAEVANERRPVATGEVQLKEIGGKKFNL